MKESLGELEQKVMDFIWKSETDIKVSQVVQNFENNYAYTTIMTVMTRLCEKKFLARKQKGKSYYYYPIKEKKDYVRSSLSKLFTKLFNSYGDLAISQFVDTIDGENDLKLLEKYLKNKKNKLKNKNIEL